MDHLWAQTQPQSANELCALLPASPATTTVLTVLSRLEAKGFVTRERSARPHLYSAVTSRAEHTASLMHEVLGSEPDRNAALARFVGRVSPQEAETLRRLLADAAGG